MNIPIINQSETSYGVRIGNTLYWVEQPAYDYILGKFSEAQFDANYQPDEDTDEPDWDNESADGFPDVTSPDEPYYDEVR